MSFQLLKPSLDYLPGYKAALERGWGPNTTRAKESGQEDLQKILKNPEAFVDSLDDLEAKGGPIILPDGSTTPRLPGFQRWMWDGEFCGNVGFRWQPGTTELPPTCFGHIGYSVVPWKQRRGYATRGLALLLPELKQYDLPFIIVTTDPDNLASQKVITANGGVFLEKFTRPASFGHAEGLRYRITI